MSIAKTLSEHRSTARAKYRKLVYSIQAGAETNAETILAIIAPVGKTAEDLQADVDKLAQRIQARADLMEATYALPLAIKGAELDKAPLIAAFNKKQAEYDAELKRLAQPIRELDQLILDARRKITSLHAPAAQLLTRTASRTIDDRLRKLQDEINGEQGQINLLQGAIDGQTETLQERVTEFEAKEVKYKRMNREGDDELIEPRARAEAARQRLAEFEHDYKPTIAAAKQRIAELEALKGTIEADRLDPFCVEFFPDEDAAEVAEEMIDQE